MKSKIKFDLKVFAINIILGLIAACLYYYGTSYEAYQIYLLIKGINIIIGFYLLFRLVAYYPIRSILLLSNKIKSYFK